jgi:hypothetical protein
MNFINHTLSTIYEDCESNFEAHFVFISNTTDDEDELWFVVPDHNICRPITPPPIKEILTDGYLVFENTYF